MLQVIAGILAGSVTTAVSLVVIAAQVRRSAAGSFEGYNKRTLDLMEERNQIDREIVSQLQNIYGELNIHNQRK